MHFSTRKEMEKKEPEANKLFLLLKKLLSESTQFSLVLEHTALSTECW